jgi:hypothetical protein
MEQHWLYLVFPARLSLQNGASDFAVVDYGWRCRIVALAQRLEEWWTQRHRLRSAATFSDLGIGLGLRDFVLNQLSQYWSPSFTADLPCNFHCVRSVHIFLSTATG